MSGAPTRRITSAQQNVRKRLYAAIFVGWTATRIRIPITRNMSARRENAIENVSSATPVILAMSALENVRPVDLELLRYWTVVTNRKWNAPVK